MNKNKVYTPSSLHDKIEELEQAYRSAVDEKKDYQSIKIIKLTLEAHKKELKQLEVSFHDEFKNLVSLTDIPSLA
jgi:hypothetical protein